MKNHLTFPLLALLIGVVSVLFAFSVDPTIHPSGVNGGIDDPEIARKAMGTEAAHTSTAPADEQEEGLVVLELFTSQGCSSCPPADDVLRDLASQDGVIALSFHVDYWNYLGWKDPFSSPWYSARQRDYTDYLKSRTYTPQLVINGRAELVGSRKDEVKQLVKQARRTQLEKIPTAVRSTVTDRDISITYSLAGDLDGVRVSAALVQQEANSSVRRGENRGRDLQHANVVRALEHQPAKRNGHLNVTAPADLDLAGAHVVLLVQNLRDQRIVGAALSDLSAR